MPSTDKGLKFDEKMGNSERLKVSFLFQPFIGPPHSASPFDLTVHYVTMTPTLQYRKQPDLHKSDFFFSVLLSFSCPPTEGYIWFLLFWRAFISQSIVKRILGRADAYVRAYVRASTDMRKKSAGKKLSELLTSFSSPRFHLIKLKVAEIQTDPSLIDLYTVHRANTINPLPDTTGPGRGLFLEMSGGGKTQNAGRRG